MKPTNWKYCRIEKTDSVPEELQAAIAKGNKAGIAYIAVELDAKDLAPVYNDMVRRLTAKAAELDKVCPALMQAWDKVTATDLAEAVNALLIERVSAEQRKLAGIVKSAGTPAAKASAPSIEIDFAE